MKRLLALLVLGMVAFAVVYHQRLYLRDPLATVTRNGVRLGGASVMINYTNDVLLQNLADPSTGARRIYLVQHWNNTAGFPAATLKCLYATACMTDADHASLRPLPARGVTMTNKVVEFSDEAGAAIRVVLR